MNPETLYVLRAWSQHVSDWAKVETALLLLVLWLQLREKVTKRATYRRVRWLLIPVGVGIWLFLRTYAMIVVLLGYTLLQVLEPMAWPIYKSFWLVYSQHEPFLTALWALVKGYSEVLSTPVLFACWMWEHRDGPLAWLGFGTVMVSLALAFRPRKPAQK